MTLCETSDQASPVDVIIDFETLRMMHARELAVQYERVYSEPARSRNKRYLLKQVIWRLQEMATGGLTERARGRVAELLDASPYDWRKIPSPVPETPE